MAPGRQSTANPDREKPPRAVVGSQVGHDEKMFGAAFDGHVVRRFAGFLVPYRRRLAVAVGSVLVYTASQISIPLVIRHAIDDALIAGSNRELLELVVMTFFAVIGVNYLTNFLQEIIVGRVAERILIDLRRAMFEHLQRVGLSFMDKTEVGRMMSRLQGDVNAMQEFLENSVFAVGDFVLLIGIMAVLLTLDWQLGLLTLSVVPILFLPAAVSRV